MISAGAVTPALYLVSMPVGMIALILPSSLVQSLGAARSESLYRDTLPWLVALVVIAVVGCVVLLLIRRLLDRETTQPVPFTLDDLRDMHRYGQLTDEEFERAKEKMLGGARAMAKLERVRLAEAERTRRRGGSGRNVPDRADGSTDANGPNVQRGDGGASGSE